MTTTCLRPVVSSLQPKLSLMKVRTSTSQGGLHARPAPTFFINEHADIVSTNRRNKQTTTITVDSALLLPASWWTESRCLVPVGFIVNPSSSVKLPTLDERIGQSTLTECHCFDPLLHVTIPTKPFSLSEDDIIIAGDDANHKMTSYDIRHLVSTVTALTDSVPDQITAWHRQCNPLSEYEKSIILMASDEKSSDPTMKVTRDPLGKPTDEQLEKILLILNDNLPSFFTRTLNYNIYHTNIVFQNNIRGTTAYGINSYIRQLSILRLIGHLKFAYVKMEVLKVTKHPEDGTIRVRWRIRGIPGYKVLFQFWNYRLWRYSDMFKEEIDWYDGFSTFYVGGDGLVHKHVCDKMMPDEEKQQTVRNLAAKLALLLGAIPRPSADILDEMALALMEDAESPA